MRNSFASQLVENGRFNQNRTANKIHSQNHEGPENIVVEIAYINCRVLVSCPVDCLNIKRNWESYVVVAVLTCTIISLIGSDTFSWVGEE